MAREAAIGAVLAYQKLQTLRLATDTAQLESGTNQNGLVVT